MDSKIILIINCVCVSLLHALNLQAQITIGLERAPHAGAVLELVSNNTRGLLMPAVSLTSSTDWALGGSPVEGMMVYNKSSSLAGGLKGKGLYVWIDGGWHTPSYAAPPNVGAISVAGTLSRNRVFQASVAAAEGVSYIWETSGTASAVGSSTTHVISLAAIRAGSLTIKVTAVNAYGTEVKQTTVTITN
ncbi:MAG: PKD domain-containing protein [Tannerellaceae bacterium]|jgi:hypothetical protein|nr:PKD domain-containing protein [Tannerellaceae bacterium]